MTRFVVISGCSGGGKSTLLDELAHRGHATVPEPGRRVVQQELAIGGTALPWLDLRAFIQRVIALARADYDAAQANLGITFLDRGLVDAVSGLSHLERTPLRRDLLAGYTIHNQVFLTPPWPEIYAADPERRHPFTEAVAEYDRLCRDYPTLGYETVELPRTGVAARADFLEATLASQ